MKTDIMSVHQYSLSSGKKDILREVVMKYIDHFYPNASGTSAVAIDNKIEQAMDLVKSHLMFAVREEVEVLKEKISELMDRINQLEYENNILKANASQETLSQLTPSGGASNASTATAAAVVAAAAAAAAAAATAAAAASTTAPSSAANSSSNGSVS